MNVTEDHSSSMHTSKLFYGWIIVIAATLIYAIAGSVVPCFGIFVKPMAREFGWSRGIITGAFGLFILLIGAVAIVAGLMVDRLGPRISNLLGGIVMGLGLFMCSRAYSVLEFYLGFSVLAGLGFAFMFVPLQTTITRWFVEKRGLALGIMFAGGGFGGLIMSFVVQYCIDLYGWRVAFVVLSILVMLITIPAAAFLRKNPEEMGLMPFGQVPGVSNAVQQAGSPAQDFTVPEAIRTRAFWIYNATMVLWFLGVFMAQINLVPHATDKGVPVAAAALGVGVASAFNALGRLFMGAVSDKLGTKLSLGLCMFVGSMMLFWLIGVKSPWMLYVFAVLFGFAYGGSMPQMPRLVSELFGLKSMGGIMGVATLITSLGPALGPVLGGGIYDRTKSYSIAFVIGAVGILVGLSFLLLLKTPVKEQTMAKK